MDLRSWSAALSCLGLIGAGCSTYSGDNEPELVEIFANNIVAGESQERQTAALDDGDLNFAEYQKFVLDYRQCVEDAGFDFVTFRLDPETRVYAWGIPANALGSEEVCYSEHLSIIDPAWQLLQAQRQGELGQNPLREKRIRCHIIHGLEYDDEWSDGQLSINLLESGIDILTCGE